MSYSDCAALIVIILALVTIAITSGPQLQIIILWLPRQVSCCGYVWQISELSSDMFIRKLFRRCFDMRAEALRSKRLRLRDDEDDPTAAGMNMLCEQHPSVDES